jgi:hypothetical protein
LLIVVGIGQPDALNDAVGEVNVYGADVDALVTLFGDVRSLFATPFREVFFELGFDLAREHPATALAVALELAHVHEAVLAGIRGARNDEAQTPFGFDYAH